MTTGTDLQPWERLEALARAGDAPGLEACLNQIGPGETFRAPLRLDPEQRERMLTTLSPDEAADLIEDIQDEHAAEPPRAPAARRGGHPARRKPPN